MKSNITISSNIYIRSNVDIDSDIEYVQKITGRKRLKKIKKQFFPSTNKDFKLTEWQEKVIENDIACLYAYSEEATHGLVNMEGKLQYVGRCEYSNCPKFNTCTETVVFYRRIDAVSVNEIEIAEKPALSYEWLGTKDIEAVFIDSEVEVAEEEPWEEIPLELIIDNLKEFVDQDDFIKISEPDRIIEAPIDSKILVNAAPGSGKTYSVIKRIECIITHRMVEDFSGVLVLVYTNAAKNEILSRLEAGIASGAFPYEARNMHVRTLDSLATSYLSTIGEELKGLGYNERIRLFNDHFEEKDFSNFEYVIIDELQDIVNERAIMTLNILKALPGGYLLLGDKCQAIYDYDCHDDSSVSSVEFYERLENSLPEDAIRYELTGNQRQVENLAKFSRDMRYALLEFDKPSDVNEFINSELDKIAVAGTVETIDLFNLDGRTAILSRNNGEAEYISHLLHKKGIAHRFLRSVAQTPSLNRWIADCLWDYQSNARVYESDFLERFRVRVADDEERARRSFNALCELVYEAPRSYLEIDKLSAALVKPGAELPEILLNPEESALTVSTIHKAKGREFDRVFLIDNGFNLGDAGTEESRVWYVGCTRAKRELNRLRMKKQYMKKNDEQPSRWSKSSVHRVAWGKKYKFHCKGITVGLPGDVLESGFAEGSLQKAVETQEYISSSVSAGDKLKVALSGDGYRILHENREIGRLDSSTLYEFHGIARSLMPGSNPPPLLAPVFVKNIITVTPYRFPEGVPLFFRTSNFWLGVEVSGFPEIDWKFNGI